MNMEGVVNSGSFHVVLFAFCEKYLIYLCIHSIIKIKNLF